MSLFCKPILLGLLLSSFAFACTLDPVCEVEDASECRENSNGTVSYRICKNAAWDEKECDASQICLKEGCVAQDNYCKEAGNRCLDFNQVKLCAAIGMAQIMMCGKNSVCDEVTCAKGQDCCVEQEICKDTYNSCFNNGTLKICVKNVMPAEQACGLDQVCKLGVCVADEVNVCDDTYKASCIGNATQVCENRKMVRTDCGDQICTVGVCADVQVIECDASYVASCDGNVAQACVARKIMRTDCDNGSCNLGACVENLCKNNRLDAGEMAVDCGGSCAACVECRVDTDCGSGGFCDSAFGYVCSKRCRTNNDCANSQLWNGEFCRGDGRCSPKVFETTWELEATDLSVVLPFDSAYPNAKCRFQILWGDEAIGTDITTRPLVGNCLDIGNRTHNYKNAGEYIVKIIGTYDGWGAFDTINISSESSLLPAATKLRSVVSFGPVGLSSKAFYGATDLRLLPNKDLPDASKLISLSATFKMAYLFNSPIGHWDTSSVADMGDMFSSAKAFNQPLANWNTSRVTDMTGMFRGATAFNQPLSRWNVSSVKKIIYMLLGSAMSSDNLCALQAIGGVWLEVSIIKTERCK